jgi:hypothetical protein
MEEQMDNFTPDFAVEVQGIKGFCPVGDRYAQEQIANRSIPVLSCEGPCIRGEIARLAANLVAQELEGFARACHAEAFYVPHSTMAEWVKTARKLLMIDGCFLTCHGRILNKLVGEEKVIHFEALPLYNKYTDLFRMDDVPEEQRKATARQVADQIMAQLRQRAALEATTA